MFPIGSIEITYLQTQANIIFNRGPREEAMILEDQAGSRTGAFQGKTSDQNDTFFIMTQSGQEIKECRFAATGWPDDGPCLSMVETE